MEITIKEVTLEKAVEINKTIVEFDGSYDLNYFRERTNAKEKLVIIAYLDTVAAGYLIGYKDEETKAFYCWMAGVSPQFRRKGILTALMDYQEHWAKERGYSKIKIKTRNCRKEMLSYLIKSNFNISGIIEKDRIQDYEILLEKEIQSQRLIIINKQLLINL